MEFNEDYKGACPDTPPLKYDKYIPGCYFEFLKRF